MSRRKNGPKPDQRSSPAKRSLTVKRQALKKSRHRPDAPRLRSSVFWEDPKNYTADLSKPFPKLLNKSKLIWTDLVEHLSTVPPVPTGWAKNYTLPDPVKIGSEPRKRLSHCAKRSLRKEVLHALGRTGRGSAGGPRRPKGEPC